MKAALRCVGYVLAGIGIAAVAVVALFASIGILFWISAATAAWFDLPVRYGVLFVLGYVVLGAGGLAGVAVCRENRS